MTCQNCERLKKRIEELEFENYRLRAENAELKRRLAVYENAHIAPHSAGSPPASVKLVEARGTQVGRRDTRARRGPDRNRTL